MSMNIKNISKIGLPKWPMCQVIGDKITTEQALDIIGKTDLFITQNCSGNNHEFNKQAHKILGIVGDDEIDWNDDAAVRNYCKAEHERRNSKGFVVTEYITNDWISCSYTGGPHGWCHPDGTIYYSDNIGKYPDTVDVLKEWKKIAKAFPFLEIYCTLMNGEYCEENIKPLITYHVSKGKVTVLDKPKELITLNTSIVSETLEKFNRGLDIGVSRENYFTLEKIKELVDKGIWPKN